MPIPTWTTGQVLVAADVNSWFVPLSIVKPSNTSRASNTSITADPHLVLALDANASYQVEALILYDGAQQSGNQANPGGISFNWTLPASATGRQSSLANASGSTALGVIAWTTTGAGDTTTVAAGGTRALRIRGVVVTTSSGNLTFLWAQTVSSTTATTVYSPSYLQAQRIA